MVRGCGPSGFSPNQSLELTNNRLSILAFGMVVLLLAVAATGIVTADASSSNILAGSDCSGGTGTLTVNVDDRSGNGLDSGEAVLYAENYDAPPESRTGQISNGQVTYYDVEGGLRPLEVYTDDGELLGVKNICQSGYTTADFSPSSPNVVQTSFSDQGDGDGTFEAGEVVNISPEVRNDEYSMDVKVDITVDGDTETRGPLTIDKGESEFYGRDYTPSHGGTYDVEIRVYGAYGGGGYQLTHIETDSFTVNSHPTSDRESPDRSVTIEQGESQTFEVDAYDVDGNLAGVEWDVEGDRQTTNGISGSTEIDSYTHNFDSPGTYTVEANVYDDQNRYNDDAVEWTVEVTEPTGDLDVTAEDANGDTVEDAELVVYGGPEDVDPEFTDANGDASFSSVTTGTYNLEIYGPDGDFWGGKTVTVDSDGTSTTIQRAAPRLSAVSLEDKGDGDGTFLVGETVNISPEIRNDDAAWPVRVQIEVDTDNDGSAETSVTRGGQSTTIGTGEYGYYGYDFEPSSAGTKQVRVVTEAYIAGRWTSTDHSEWTKSFTVESNTGSLVVTGVDQDENSVQNAEIILYDSNWNEIASKTTGSSGGVSWDSLATGEYKLELYGPEGAFWGGNAVDLGIDGESTTIHRTAPYLSEVSLEDLSNGDGSFAVGETINIAPKVRNDGYKRPVRVQIYFDRNDDGNYDEHVTRGGLNTNISEGSFGWYGYDLKLSTTGKKHVRVVTESYINSEWVATGYSGRTKSFTVSDAIEYPVSDTSVEVISINGEAEAANGYDVETAIKQFRIKVTGPNGDPLTKSELELNAEHYTRDFTLTHEGNGIYEIETSETPGFRLYASTEYFDFEIKYPDQSGTKSFDVPVVSGQDGLQAPIEGWSYHGTTRVEVDGTEYIGVQLFRDGEYESDIDGRAEIAWIVFNQDGTLVTDSETRRKAALTAMVSYQNQRTGQDDVEFLKSEYPGHLEKQLLLSEIGSGLIVVRDTSAELLGTIGGAAVTGGSNIAAKTTIKAATKATAKKLSKDIVKNYLESNIIAPSDLKSDPAGAMEKAIKLKARAEITDAAAESREAGRILDRHDSGEQWDHSDAKRYWKSKNESITDGMLYTSIRVNQLPSGDPRDQLIDIGKSVATGATGVPIDTMTSLITGDQLGYISESVDETARLRAVMALESRSFKAYSKSAQQQARDQYGNQVLYAPPGEITKSASISIVETPAGKFANGETVNTTVRVTNTGDTTSRFFVGYSTATTVDGDQAYFDNHGTTGHFVTLTPGSSVTTNVSWRVQSNVPVDKQYDTIVAVWPEFPREGIQAYQRQERTDVFRVVEGVSFRTDRLQTTSDRKYENQESVFVADVTNTGYVSGSTLVNLTVDGTVVEQKLVRVGPDQQESVVFYHEFNRTGTLEVSVGSEQTSVTVRRKPSFDGPAVYVWGYASTLATDEDAAARFFERADDQGLETVYLSWGALKSVSDSARTHFIQQAHSEGIEVHALVGTAGSNAISNSETSIEEVLSYNDGKSDSEQFDGIHLDAEPGESDLPVFLEEYETMLDGARTDIESDGGTVKSQNLTLSSAVGWWWAEQEPSATENILEQNSLDYIVVMAYHEQNNEVRDRLSTVTSRTEIPYVLAIETQEFPQEASSEKITLYEEGKTDVYDLRNGIEDNPPNSGYLGSALHYYQSSVSKWDALQDVTVTESTVSAGGTAQFDVDLVLDDNFPRSSHESNVVVRLTGQGETYEKVVTVSPEGSELTTETIELTLPDDAPTGEYDVTVFLNDTTYENTDYEAVATRADPVTLSTFEGATVTVESSSSVAEAVDMDNDGWIEDTEILHAIEMWRTDDRVPNTGGKTIGDLQIMELIEMWRTNSVV